MFHHRSPRKRPQARRIIRALATPAVLGTLGVAVFTTPAPAAHTPVGNATFPGSNYRCSDGQKTLLKAAWQEAYSYTKRAEQMIDHIAAQPAEGERRRLWEQDFRGYGSPEDRRRVESPQRYFGAYDRERLGRVQSALDDARRRFEGKTMYLITCSTVCAKKKSTTAHHAVKGRIVTCSLFWSLARDKSLTAQEQLATSAFTLAHEVFHHIFVKVDGVWAALGDYHGDGVGGHTDQKYYGVGNVTTLAREKANWAVRNNDSYAYFAQSAGVIAPAERFTSVYADKEGTGTGALYRDMTWAQLNTKKAELAPSGQYLADVETYVREVLDDRRSSQQLIDIERYLDGGRVFQIGVYRHAAAGRGYIRQAWDALVGRWQASAPRTLIDIEEDSNVAMEY